MGKRKIMDYDLIVDEYNTKTENLEIETRLEFYKLLPRLVNKSVLDVGCGAGQDALYYVGEGARVSGIDISSEQIALAKEKNIGTFVQGDMSVLPFDDNSFDVVTTWYALQNAKSVEKVLDEMVRVVKPNGLISILTKHPVQNLLESWKNDHNGDYFNQEMVTSLIYNKTISLYEQGHTVQEYLPSSILSKANLVHFSEGNDFPASEQVIDGIVNPTYLLLSFKKK